jgi:hypothetical protein
MIRRFEYYVISIFFTRPSAQHTNQSKSFFALKEVMTRQIQAHPLLSANYKNNFGLNTSKTIFVWQYGK